MAINPSAIELCFRLYYPGQAVPALDVDIKLPSKGITAVVGHSGGGKSSLLRCIAGLQKADGGTVNVGDVSWQSGQVFIPVHQRELGFVFQEASLFSHLNVKSNLIYASKRCRQSMDNEYGQRIVNMLKLGPLLERDVESLSGGERQRVAIGRALLTRPKLLMMDEPLASLDSQSKQSLLPQLRQILHELAIPVIYVTHSMDEVCQLAQHVMVLEQGRVKLQGALNEVLSQLDRRDTNGSGPVSVLEAEIVKRDEAWHMIQARGQGVSLWLAEPVKDPLKELGKTLRLQVLASDVSLSLTQDEQSSIVNRLSAKVVKIEQANTPAMCIVHLQSGCWRFVAQVSRRSVHALNITPEQILWAQIKSAALLS